MQRILAVDDEPDILRLTVFLLESWGYDVQTARSGREAVERARRDEPDLILMDVNMEDMNGFEACERIKADFSSSCIPVIMLTSQDHIESKISGLGRGADDYVIKTVDPLELQARVEMVLRRTREQSGANPLTRLPGNLALERQIRERLERGSLFSVCYADLDNFKAYNDKYGFDAGDDVIVHTAQLVVSCVRELGGVGDFIGHIGGDDFVIVSTPERDDALCRGIIAAFDASIENFYDASDLERAGIEVENRSGVLDTFPIMSITLAILRGTRDDFRSTHLIAERAVELKKYLKRFPGSNYQRERRELNNGKPEAALDEAGSAS